MASVVQSASYGVGNGSTPNSITLPSPPTEGNLLLAFNSISPAFGGSDPGPAWELLDAQAVGWPSSGAMYLYRRLAGAGESATVFTVTTSGATRQTGAVIEVAEATLEAYPFRLVEVGSTSQSFGPVTPSDSSLPYLLLALQIVGHAQALNTLDGAYTLLQNAVGNSGGSSNRLIAAYRDLGSVDGVSAYDGTNVYAAAVDAGTWHIALSGVDPYDGVGTIATGWAG